MTGSELISQEREEQIKKHGRSIEDDINENEDGQLSLAARILSQPTIEDAQGPPYMWDSPIWYKMIKKSYKERLIIAGALLAAEIDRMNN